MPRACWSRISAKVTRRDTAEMSLQRGEIPRQTPPSRRLAMDSQASRDTHPVAVPATLTAPPASSVVEHGPDAFKATVRVFSAKNPYGAGTVVRAGSVVAPALLGDGPGTSSAGRSGRIADGPGIDTSACYPARVIFLAIRPATADARVSSRTAALRTLRRRGSGTVRGDRSRHRPQGQAGTRSGDRRDVSLSPVPASHTVSTRHRFPLAPPRICRDRVARPQA